jgi:KipI family sensor histidine kinase inhibitor
MAVEWRLEFLGDAALSVHVVAEAPLEANAGVHRLASRLRAAEVPGVKDVVPGMRSLVVHVDPLRCDIGRITAALDAGGEGPVAPASPRRPELVEIPVTYGGAAGPDLEHVATACGLAPDEVCRRHAASEYVVCFVGFLPGFPYLGLLDPALRLPRRRTPRPVVAPGSVAIAGEYTGVYPWASPGGWHLIGHTDERLFDVEATPPARLAPGTRVRFVERHR